MDAERVLAWIDDLIECTCRTPPVLVGQITGGAMAARFAAERVERLRAVVLVDTLGLAEFQPAPEFGLALTEYIAQPTEATFDHLWRQCAFDLDTLRSGMGERWERIKAYSLDRVHAPEHVIENAADDPGMEQPEAFIDALRTVIG